MCRLRTITALLCAVGCLLATVQPVAAAERLSETSPSPAAGFNGAHWINTANSEAALLDGKVVLVNFWATWCPPCLEELPSIQKLWASLDRSDFEVVAVNVGEDQKTVERFLQNFDPQLEFPIVLDKDLTVYRDWEVSPLPTTFIVDRSSKVRFKGIGEFNFDSDAIRSDITNLIQESAKTDTS